MPTYLIKDADIIFLKNGEKKVFASVPGKEYELNAKILEQIDYIQLKDGSEISHEQLQKFVNGACLEYKGCRRPKVADDPSLNEENKEQDGEYNYDSEEFTKLESQEGEKVTVAAIKGLGI